MLVKVNDNYTGVFGLRSSYSMVPKRAGDPPFEVPDDSAAHHIKTGVLVPVEVMAKKAEPAPMPEPVQEEEAPVIEAAEPVAAPKKAVTKKPANKKRK